MRPTRSPGSPNVTEPHSPRAFWMRLSTCCAQSRSGASSNRGKSGIGQRYRRPYLAQRATRP